MKYSSHSRSSSIRDVRSCRAWIDALPHDGPSRLAEFGSLLQALLESGLPAEEMLAIAEAARPAHLATIDTQLAAIDPLAFPMRRRDDARLRAAIDGLRLGAELFARGHEALGGAALLIADAADPRTPRQMQAFVRALDYRARLIIAQQRLRVEANPSDWDELCLMANSARGFGLADVAVTDPLSRRGVNTCREIFIVPVLLHLAAPADRAVDEFTLSLSLARRWARRVDFRLGDGLGAQDTSSGPTVELSARSAVRLATGRLKRRLQARIEEIGKTGASALARLPGGMAVQRAVKLMNMLVSLWGEPRSVLLGRDSSLGSVSLRFGFPVVARANQPGTAQQPVRRGYVYGQFEEETVIRRTGSSASGDALSEWLAGGGAAELLEFEGERAAFSGTFTEASVTPGGLVLMQVLGDSTQPRAVAPESGQPQRRLGQVRSCSQRPAWVGGEVDLQRIGVEVWPGRPAFVSIGLPGQPGFRDALLLEPERDGDPMCVVLPEAAIAEPCIAVLRAGQIDRRVQVEELLDQGRGFVRARIRWLQG